MTDAQLPLPGVPQAAVKPRGRWYIKPDGYAAPPGSGPTGETCATCDHLVRRTFAKAYLKCGLMRGHWTGGRKTDVLARSPACGKWEAEG